MISCTISVADNTDENERLVRLLPTAGIPEPSASYNIFVVRPSQDFVSDSDRNALETHYPDLFPFGRAGFGEQRKIRISNKALVAYYINLAIRQFRKTDFALPVYELVARAASSNMAVNRANLPSHPVSMQGNITKRAEAYGRIPIPK